MEETNRTTSSFLQSNVLSVMDFIPFSNLHIAENLIQSIFQPPDEFTNEVFHDWLLLVIMEGLQFIKDLLTNPSLFLQLPYPHRNLCLGWFAFYCNYLPSMVEKHPSTESLFYLIVEDRDFFTEFCQSLQQCLQAIFDMDPQHVSAYHTWCQFYSLF